MSRGELGTARRRRKQSKIDWLHKIDVEDLLETMEVLNIRRARSDEIKFSCPFSGHKSGDDTPSAYMNTGELDKEKATQWKCHGCGRQGNAISFVADCQDISRSEATTWLRKQYAGDFRSPKGGSISAEFEMRLRKREERAQLDRPDPVLPEETLDKFYNDWADDFCEWSATHDELFGYMFERGFEPETMMDWQIGWDDRSERWTIPVRNDDGELMGFKARTPFPDVKPKYKVLGGRRYGFQTYQKSRYVFGLDKIEHSTPCGIIVEGELNVIAMHQLGHVNTCGIAGSSMSEVQSRLIRDYFDEVVLLFDWDLAGHRATWGYVDEDGDEHPGVVEMLEPFIRVRIAGEHEGDPADYMKEGYGDQLDEVIEEARSSTSFFEVPAPPGQPVL